jgi:hypothetical protein
MDIITLLYVSDINMEILSYVNDTTLHNLCKTNKHFYQLFRNPLLWQLKLTNTYRFPIVIGNDVLSKNIYYSLKYNQYNSLYYWASVRGYHDIIEWLRNYPNNIT